MKKTILATALLMLLAFLIPIEHKYDKLFRYFSLTLIPKGLEISKGFDKKIYFYVSDFLSMSLLFIGIFWFKIPLRRFFAHPLWIVFVCALASIIVSPFIHYPLAYIRLLQLMTPLLLFSFLANAFRSDEKEKVTAAVLGAIVLAGLFQTVVATLQYFKQGPLGLRILGESSSMSTVPIAGGARWIFDRLSESSSSVTEIIRAAGTVTHPNVFGGFMVISLISTYYLMTKYTTKRWLWGATLPFQFFAMALSYSRAAIFAWAIASTIWLIQKRERYVALMIGISVCASAILLHEQYISRGGVINYNSVSQGSDAIRLFHQKTAFDIIAQVPLFGLGYGQFSERAVNFFPPTTSSYVSATGPHNIYLFLTCETGLISLTGFILFIITLLWALIKTPKTVETITLGANFISFLFIGFCDFYPLIFQQGKLMFFIVAGLLAANVQYLKKREPIHA